jgi:hypothetical protein
MLTSRLRSLPVKERAKAGDQNKDKRDSNNRDPDPFVRNVFLEPVLFLLRVRFRFMAVIEGHRIQRTWTCALPDFRRDRRNRQPAADEAGRNGLVRRLPWISRRGSLC